MASYRHGHADDGAAPAPSAPQRAGGSGWFEAGGYNRGEQVAVAVIVTRVTADESGRICLILPAALPSYVGGLKQGWSFAWRSLMAGELLVAIGNKPALGVRLDYARTLADYPLLISYMIVILIIGIVVDAIFGVADRRIRSRRGLLVGS